MHMDKQQIVEAAISLYSGDLDETVRIEQRALLLIRADELGIGPRVERLLRKYDKLDEDADREDRRDRIVAAQELPLERDRNGRPADTIKNYLLVMEQDPRYSGVRYNLLSNRPEVHIDGTIRAWRDVDDSRSRAYIEKMYHIHNEKKHRDALRMLFDEREYHPIKDLLDTIEWDGINRVENFLAIWAKCEETPYTREVSRLIFAGGINRLYNPGCKFDDVPVLVGTAQGEGKSTLVRWLAMNDIYYAVIGEFEGKASIEQLDGVWIGELAELLALTKTKEQEAVKSYISCQCDRTRRPYGERIEDMPRRCIFVGTTNDEQFLRDKTGNRRFYPVAVHSSGYWLYDNEEDCRDFIRQCWAEAKIRFDKGEMPNYANKALIADYQAAQEAAMEDDWRIGAIGLYLDSKAPGDCVCARELMHHALSPDPEHPKDPTPKDSKEIGQIMAKHFKDWRRVDGARFAAYGFQRGWRKPLPDVREYAQERIPD